jgi:hypothetical protein
MLKTIITTALFSALVVANTLNAQVSIDNTDLTNPPATSCTATHYTVSGVMANTNYGYSGPIINVVGFNISIEMPYFSGFAPMPGATPYSEDMDLGILAVGTYTVSTNTLVDGIPSASDVGIFDVIIVNPVNLGNDTTICDTSSLVLDVTTAIASYEWQDGSTGATFTIVTTGVYWVEVTDSNGCVSADSITVTVQDCSLGLNEINSPASILMYPNPAVSTIQLIGIEGESTVSIYTLAGNLMAVHSNTDTIDISTLKAGAYLVKVAQKNTVLTKRLIVQD